MSTTPAAKAAVSMPVEQTPAASSSTAQTIPTTKAPTSMKAVAETTPSANAAVSKKAGQATASPKVQAAKTKTVVSPRVQTVEKPAPRQDSQQVKAGAVDTPKVAALPPTKPDQTPGNASAAVTATSSKTADSVQANANADEKASSFPVRAEVQAAVKVAETRARAKATAKAEPSSSTSAAPVSKEKVKTEKPKAAGEPGEKLIPVIPAQVPSPSVVGVTAPPPTSVSSTMQVAAPGAQATWRSSPAIETLEPPAPVERTSAKQISGTTTGVETISVTKGEKAATESMEVSVPKKAVELVARVPVPASVSLPPSAATVSESVPTIGYANALSSLAQGAAKTLGFAPSPAAQTSAALATAKAGPAPKSVSTAPATPIATKASSAGDKATPASSPSAPKAVFAAPATPAVTKASSAGAAPASSAAQTTASAGNAKSQQGQGATRRPAAEKPVATMPKEGPAVVAAGRSVVRGACPAIKRNADGDLVTPISKKYQIVFISSEVAPWSKTGGLGEAMDGLPVALAAFGHRVMTISPRYDQYEEGWDTGYWSDVPMGDLMEPVHAFHCYQSKVDRVFIDHDCFLSKALGKSGSMIYGPEWGKDFADNQWRFIYFAKACLKIIQELPLGGFTYGSNCVVVVNDWHSAMVPVYLRVEREANPEKWAETKTALLIHNAVFQGRFDRDDPEEPADAVYGLPPSTMESFTFEMPLSVGRTEPKIKRCINWMAAAAKHVDRNITVSPTYAWELINLPEFGVELDDIFLEKGMTGIVNGVKEAISPMNETFVEKAKMPSTFSIKDVDEKKAEMKAMLQELYELPQSPETPLFIFVGRMDLQKGYDYIITALTCLLDTLDIQVILIGTGRSDLVASTKALANKFPEKVYMAGWCGPERYAMVAGADFNLMPSRWEPCGLAQMESMRFGTLPMVSQTGGLVDTVEDMVTGIHLNGAVSVEKELDPLSVELVAQGIERCATVYEQSAQISKMRKLAMAAGNEFTWSNAALQYETVFEDLNVVDVLPICSSSEVTLKEDNAVA